MCSDKPELLRNRYDENFALFGRTLAFDLVDEADMHRNVVLAESELVSVATDDRRRSNSAKGGTGGGSKARIALTVGMIQRLGKFRFGADSMSHTVSTRDDMRGGVCQTLPQRLEPGITTKAIEIVAGGRLDDDHGVEDRSRRKDTWYSAKHHRTASHKGSSKLTRGQRENSRTVWPHPGGEPWSPRWLNTISHNGVA